MPHLSSLNTYSIHSCPQYFCWLFSALHSESNTLKWCAGASKITADPCTGLILISCLFLVVSVQSSFSRLLAILALWDIQSCQGLVHRSHPPSNAFLLLQHVHSWGTASTWYPKFPSGLCLSIQCNTGLHDDTKRFLLISVPYPQSSACCLHRGDFQEASKILHKASTDSDVRSSRVKDIRDDFMGLKFFLSWKIPASFILPIWHNSRWCKTFLLAMSMEAISCLTKSMTVMRTRL